MAAYLTKSTNPHVSCRQTYLLAEILNCANKGRRRLRFPPLPQAMGRYKWPQPGMQSAKLIFWGKGVISCCTWVTSDLYIDTKHALTLIILNNKLCEQNFARSVHIYGKGMHIRDLALIPGGIHRDRLDILFRPSTDSLDLCAWIDV